MIKSKSMSVVAAALTLCMAGSAFAQDRRFDADGDRRGPARFEQQRPDDRRGPPDFGRHGHDRRDEWRYAGPRDAGPHAGWRRGGYVPREYRAPDYVVSDWRARHLQAPPRGYQWVGVGGEFALAAIATGLIAQIVLSH